MSRKKNINFDNENLIEYTDENVSNDEIVETVDKSIVETFDTVESSEIKDVPNFGHLGYINVIDNIKSCKVIKAISNDKAIIDFDGFGLIATVDDARSLCGKRIDIKYSGNIGKADFKYEVV